MTVQLAPPIPVTVVACPGKPWPLGYGYCIAWTDYSQEHNRLWLVAFDAGGECWDIPQPYVRLRGNVSMERSS
jgi:hypothetical protein